MCYEASCISTQLSYTLWSGFPTTQCGSSRRHSCQQSGRLFSLPSTVCPIPIILFYCSFIPHFTALLQFILKTHTSVEGPICKVMCPQLLREQPRLLTSRSDSSGHTYGSLVPRLSPRPGEGRAWERGQTYGFPKARRLNLFLQCIFTDVENSKLTSGVLNHGSAVVLVRLKLCSLVPSNSLEPRPGSGE